MNLHDTNARFIRAAKIHIAYSILFNKGNCLLKLGKNWDTTSDLGDISKSWMLDFFKMISNPSISTSPVNLLKNVSVINFNYDRCLEQLLLSAIPNLYGIPVEDASSIIKSATIIHPYGQVGDLPTLTQSSDSVKFGEVSHFSNIMNAANLIKTYTKQVNSNIATQIKNVVNTNSRVVFLGFGYHKQNVELLSSPPSAANNRPVIGTAIGESEANIIEYGERLRDIGGTPVPGQRMPENMILLPHLDCSMLLQNYREVITS